MKTMRLCFYSSDPPLRDQAYGNHGVARNFIEILRQEDPVILSRRSRKAINLKEAASVCGSLEFWLHPCASGWGLKRLLPTSAGIVDGLLFAFWLPVLFWKLRRAGIERIFVLCGADAWFLINVRLLQTLGIPVDVYLVDDIEDSSTQGLYRRLPGFIHRLLKSVLRHSARNFAISPGFAEHLSDRFGVSATWLPLPAPSFPESAREPVAKPEARKPIVFIGALNRLYADALRELYDEISRFNRSGDGGYKLILKIISYSNTKAFLDTLPDTEWVEAHERLERDAMQRHLSEAHACFLPYSFAASEKLMVSTSFSCKILEYFECRRPILVYGPAYASIPRYFRELGLPLCATSREELRESLPRIEAYDTPELIGRYREAWRRFHSPQAIRSILLSPAGAEDATELRTA